MKELKNTETQCVTPAIRDFKLAFADALDSGVLTEKTKNSYMYMYTDLLRGDAFKHKATRKYIFNNHVLNNPEKLMLWPSTKEK